MVRESSCAGAPCSLNWVFPHVRSLKSQPDEVIGYRPGSRSGLGIKGKESEDGISRMVEIRRSDKWLEY